MGRYLFFGGLPPVLFPSAAASSDEAIVGAGLPFLFTPMPPPPRPTLCFYRWRLGVEVLPIGLAWKNP